MAAATDVVAEQGVEHASTRDIYARAGITAPTLYHHSKTSDDSSMTCGDQPSAPASAPANLMDAVFAIRAFQAGKRQAEREAAVIQAAWNF